MPERRRPVAQQSGTVVWFNNSKGYGFLRAENGREVFCHYSAINSEGYRSLQEGQRVEFDVLPGDTGRDQAANVRVLK